MAEELLEKEEPLKGRARLEAKFKENNPDTDYSDDETFYAAFDEYDTDRDNKLGEYDNLTEKIRSAVDADPHAGMFLANFLDGTDLVSNLIDCLGPELVDAVNSPEAREKLREAQEQAAAIEEERQANLEASQGEVDAFLADKDPVDVDSFDDFLRDLLDKLATGRFDSETLNYLWAAYKHDEDVAEAREEGNIEGRNAQISARAANRAGGDGVPSLAQASQAVARPSAPSKEAPRSIWEMDKTKEE